MIDQNLWHIAAELNASERKVLRSLPAYDRGHLPDDIWWAYLSILDQRLAESDGNFLIIATARGQAVLRTLDESGMPHAAASGRQAPAQ